MGRMNAIAKRASGLPVAALLSALSACSGPDDATLRLRWYVFDEPSGAFAAAARRCSETSQDGWQIEIVPLPADADQQREQLVRRLAAGDTDIDIIGMDVIWTAEFAAAGWVLPWQDALADNAREGRLQSAIDSATWAQRLWAAPFTTNTQLLWYRTDRIDTPPATWEEMIDMAERLGERGAIQAQGERYEGFTVFFVSMLASAGGSVVEPDGQQVALEEGPMQRALAMMQRFAGSPAADPALSTAREDEARLAFESGDASFMLNYTYVWPSANANAPQVARNMGWARWPAVVEDQPSRVSIGGINLGVAAHSRHPALAFEAASCLASAANQRLAATRG
ncbi:MAG: extracellular solute-binding protein, partial [Thiogranum sp.]|nr:extracellular solute-binding protein [Thiogranum sp.]